MRKNEVVFLMLFEVAKIHADQIERLGGDFSRPIVGGWVGEGGHSAGINNGGDSNEEDVFARFSRVCCKSFGLLDHAAVQDLPDGHI
jgi:hypothetical protein